MNHDPKDGGEKSPTEGAITEHIARSLVEHVREASTVSAQKPSTESRDQIIAKAKKLAAAVADDPSLGIEAKPRRSQPIATRMFRRARQNLRMKVGDNSGGAVFVGDGNTQINIYSHKDPLDHARWVFQQSLQRRDKFIGTFLQQALHQANITFRLSLLFMTAGGLVVLIAGALALADAADGGNNGVAIVSGLGGAIVGACGGAFSIKADRARKHLAVQAEKMQSQLLNEQKFVQVAELMDGVKDPDLNDRARVALAIRILGGEPNDPNAPKSDEDRAGD